MTDEHDSGERYLDAVRSLKSTLQMAPARAAEMERDLGRAFAECRQAPHFVVAPPTPAARWRREWIAAAATIALIAATAVVWRQSRDITVNQVTGRPAAAVNDVRLPPNAAVREEPLIEAGAGHTGPSRSSAVGPRPQTSARHSRIRPAAPATQERIIRPAGFVAVPAAAGLPQFESGTIVRVELPVSVLPDYGVDISPAAGVGPVEADVLVGQDGQPRAIRLVTNNSRSSR